MTIAKDNFIKNMNSIMELDGIYNYLYRNNVTVIQISEILRAQIVMIVSAMDYYIHEVVRDGLLELFDNPSVNKGFDKISIPLKMVKVLFNIDDDNERKRLLGEAIKEVTSKETYQSPTGIEYALSLIDVKAIWSRLSQRMSMRPEDIKATLSLIVFRRNKIAHEADIDQSTSLKRSISRESDILTGYNFIMNLVSSIDLLVEEDLLTS